MEVMLILAVLILLTWIFVVLDDRPDTSIKVDRISLECIRDCSHTDCEYHPENTHGHTARADLMWSPACPYYTYTDDIDDPEG